MKMLDNINSTVRDDLQQSIRKGRGRAARGAGV